MSITVAEIEALLPNSKIYSLDPEVNYLVTVSRIKGGTEAMAQRLSVVFKQAGIEKIVVVLVSSDDAIKLYELSGRNDD